jgi:signal transduction histidine kinase
MARKRGERINTSYVSTSSYLGILAIVSSITVGEAFILDIWFGQTLTLVGVLTYYVAINCFFCTIILSITRKYLFDRPLHKITKAARKITGGDFSVRIEPTRRSGKKGQIDVLVEDFNKMAEELSSVEMFKNNFISNVSHEIKSPLSIIQSYAKALKAPDLSVEQRDEYADIVVSASKRLSVMVENILKLSKLENQEITPLPKAYQLGEQLRHCALFFMDSWQQKGIDLQIDVQDVIVNSDESLLEIVWNNLISNAIKFTEPGGVIRITSYQEESFIVVKIKDSGCGMDEEIAVRIFDKFYQGDTSHSTEGNGLGLSLVKKVIEIVGGKIAVESKPKEGSVFTVKLKI